VHQPPIEIPSAEAVGSDRDPPSAPFWSPWATVGWGLLVAVTFVAIQIGVTVVWMTAHMAMSPEREPAPLATIAESGDLFAVASLVTSVSCSVLVWLLVWFRRRDRAVATIGLVRPSPHSAAAWLGATAALIVASDALTLALGRPIVPPFMTDLFLATDVKILLVLAVVAGAPFFEELFFRGFLLTGLRRSVLGDTGAVLSCALAWAAIHLQYDLYDITTIFVFGLVLGAARLRSGSLWTPITMHVLANLVATVETTLVLRP
jgi:membrane protease YdiL (CAAX protease family)